MNKIGKVNLKIDQKQRLYVIREGKGYSCLGWDVCKRWTEGLHKELLECFNDYKNSDLCKQNYPKGTWKAYFRYVNLVELARNINLGSGYRFNHQLEPRLIGLEGKRVEVTDKEGNKRRFYVGKSTGFVPVHLEISKRNSTGGDVVYIRDTDTIKVIGER